MATIENVVVRLERDDNQKFVVKVQVVSRKKPGLRANVEIDPGQSHNNPAFIKLLQAAAGAAAEYLGKYGDNIDPSECTKHVLEAFKLEAHQMKMLTLDAPTKMKAIGDNLSRLQNSQQEIYKSIKRRMEMPGYILVHREFNWINKMIREIF